MPKITRQQALEWMSRGEAYAVAEPRWGESHGKVLFPAATTDEQIASLLDGYRFGRDGWAPDLLLEADDQTTYGGDYKRKCSPDQTIVTGGKVMQRQDGMCQSCPMFAEYVITGECKGAPPAEVVRLKPDIKWTASMHNIGTGYFRTSPGPAAGDLRYGMDVETAEAVAEVRSEMAQRAGATRSLRVKQCSSCAMYKNSCRGAAPNSPDATCSSNEEAVIALACELIKYEYGSIAAFNRLLDYSGMAGSWKNAKTGRRVQALVAYPYAKGGLVVLTKYPYRVVEVASLKAVEEEMGWRAKGKRSKRALAWAFLAADAVKENVERALQRNGASYGRRRGKPHMISWTYMNGHSNAFVGIEANETSVKFNGGNSRGTYSTGSVIALGSLPTTVGSVHRHNLEARLRNRVEAAIKAKASPVETIVVEAVVA